MAPLLTRIGLALAVIGSLAQAPIKSPLVRAKTFYNAERFDAAIEAATEAIKDPLLANAANVVLARAYLERYRAALAQGQQAPIDLSRARDALKTVDASKLGVADRAEYFTGLGVSLFLEDQNGGPPLYGAAAEMFELALTEAGDKEPATRETLLEWWAGALDRQAQIAGDAERRGIYGRVLKRAEDELHRRPASSAAHYWVAAAARGTDDLERAWGAAVAAWIRAPQLADGVRLRDDLDRLVLYAILPDRARLMTPGGDAHAVLTLLTQQWDELKQKWIR